MRFAALAFGPLIGASTAVSAWQARIEATSSDAARLLHLAAGLRDLRSLDRAAVESALGGARLAETNRTDAFGFFEASRLPMDAMTIAHVDYREPVSGGPATAGALLVLDVEGPCIRRAAIEARFGRLTLTDAPRGHSLDEKMVWSLELPDRTLGFGFPERDAACLGTVSLASRSPPEKKGSR